MDREILFRGKRIDNGEWESGSLVRVRMGCSDERVYIADKMTGYLTPVIPETVGEWTGLKDKNGKKIFEHDRIKYKCGDIAEVIFTEYGAFVGLTESLSHENIGGVLTEVIGNKWENNND